MSKNYQHFHTEGGGYVDDYEDIIGGDYPQKQQHTQPKAKFSGY